MTQTNLLATVTALGIELLDAELAILPLESQGRIRAARDALRVCHRWLADEVKQIGMAPKGRRISRAARRAARARELYDEQAKERQKRKPKAVVENLPQPDRARDAAGKAVGVSGRAARRGRKQ